MIERNDGITEKAIIIGLVISLFIFVLSIKSNTSNTIMSVGNIGLPTGVIDTLRKLLGH